MESDPREIKEHGFNPLLGIQLIPPWTGDHADAFKLQQQAVKNHIAAWRGVANLGYTASAHLRSLTTSVASRDMRAPEVGVGDADRLRYGKKPAAQPRPLTAEEEETQERLRKNRQDKNRAQRLPHNVFLQSLVVVQTSEGRSRLAKLVSGWAGRSKIGVQYMGFVEKTICPRTQQVLLWYAVDETEVQAHWSDVIFSKVEHFTDRGLYGVLGKDVRSIGLTMPEGLVF